ncbi:MAG: hypothetical protein EOO62_29535 [Hymenobacter sp.]|nr:MAG: hypothetical protein EOO62_29535 [Hymenobacter sp.]
MFSTLLRRLGLLPGLVLFLLGLGLAHPALASHLLGGEMTYKYLDSNGPTGAAARYEIKLFVYNNCNNSNITSPYEIAIYDRSVTPATRITLTSTNYNGNGANSILGGNMYVPGPTSSRPLSPSLTCRLIRWATTRPGRLMPATARWPTST